MLIFNARDPQYKSPIRAVATDEPVHLRLVVSRDMHCSGARLVVTKDGETGSANAPANAAAQRPAPRITPPIGRIASPSQSANKRRLASLTDSAIALPYFVPRKPFEADVGAVRAWESPYATTKLNNR